MYYYILLENLCKGAFLQHKISNSFVEIKVNDLGAELCSLKRKDDKIEYIWQGDEKYWSRHAPILFPIVGKLLDNEYIHENKIYKMNQHGFIRDTMFMLIKKEHDSLCFKVESSPETLKIYPFKFEIYVTYTLKKSTVDISYKVVNKSNKIMLFSIGSHPAFNWPLENENKNDYYLEFQDTNTLERVPLTDKGISNKTIIIELIDNKLDLKEELFYNDAIIIENLKNKFLNLKNKKNNRFINISFDGSYIGFWSKHNGAPFICIEPWHGIADSITHNKKFEDKKGIIHLNKNNTFITSYSISI